MPRKSTADAPAKTSRRRAAKPKTTDVLVVAVLDRSGSMGVVRDETIEGWNTYLADLQADEEGETFLILLGFDHEREVWVDGAAVGDVEPLTHATYVPRGNTALYDAIAHGLTLAEKRLGELGRPEMKVLVPIITDGYENASVEYAVHANGLARVKALIEEYEARGNFTVAYLSSDLSVPVHVAAASLGISQGNAAATSSTPASASGVYGTPGPEGTPGALYATTSSLRTNSKSRSDTAFADAGVDNDLTDEAIKERGGK